MAREEFDLCVIGGGINGAAVARDAALRGLKVALVEAGERSAATSSRSSKLIHGGLRYLPQWRFPARLPCAARTRAPLRRQTAPHLVHPIQFLFPIYKGQSFGRIEMDLGLFLYDLFALHAVGRDAIAIIGAKATLRREPARWRKAVCLLRRFTTTPRATMRASPSKMYSMRDCTGAAVANYVLVEALRKRWRPHPSRRACMMSSTTNASKSARASSSMRRVPGSTTSAAWTIPPRPTACGSPRAYIWFFDREAAGP